MKELEFLLYRARSLTGLGYVLLTSDKLKGYSVKINEDGLSFQLI